VTRVPVGVLAAACGACAHAFCSGCDYPAPHAPATCAMVAAWQDKGGKVEASDEDLANWLAIKKVRGELRFWFGLKQKSLK
jgi:hypothetical protein